MSDETLVELLLRETVNWTDPIERRAIDCGREAIRLLCAWADIPHNVDLAEWIATRAALLAKCREDGR